jgi:uncharacterized protein involved in exopolysaccharide biosynthesis
MSERSPVGPTAAPADPEDREEVDLLGLFVLLLLHWKTVVLAPLLAGLVALGITYLIPKTYTSRTVFLPPQQQQSAAAAALAQLSALSGLSAAAGGVRTPGDQYVALLQSQSVADRIIDAFDLVSVYEADYRFEARKELAENSRIGLGRRDGLITIEVDDTVPQRAADIANRYVDELRRLTREIALTEAQQRRAFFEGHLKLTRERLVQAQASLQASGFSQGALKADARAAAENYARVRAEATAAEIRLQAQRVRLADTTTEVQASLATLRGLRVQLAALEQGAARGEVGDDYISRFRDFKYQETLFDLFTRQYELARVDEAREGALIQVVDLATPAERKGKPRRAFIAVATTFIAAVGLAICIVLRYMWRLRPGPTLRARLESMRGA